MERSLRVTFEVITPVTASRPKLGENATGVLISPNAPWKGGCCFILFVMMKVRSRALPKVTDCWLRAERQYEHCSLPFTFGIFSLNGCLQVSLHDLEKSYQTFPSLDYLSGNVHLV